jgi:hypothetical protein
VDREAAGQRHAEIRVANVRPVPDPVLARPPPTRQTGRKERLNFLYPLTVLPGVELTITASIDPVAPPPGYDACGTQSTLPAIPGRTVRWCYSIRNVSSIPRTRHTLVTTQSGSVLNDFQYTLAPDAAAFITATQVMGATAIDEAATWTAFRPGPVHLSTATATARVLAVADVIFITGFDPGT